MPYAVIACAFVFFWVISLRAYLFTVLPTIAAELGMSPSVAGALIGTLSLGYCLAVWSAGFLPARPKQVILVGIGLSVLGMTAVALSPNAAALFAAAVVAGVGSGVYMPLGLAIIVAASAPGQRSRNMGLHELAATAGYFSAAGFVALTVGTLDWRQATLVWCIAGILALGAMLRLRGEPLVRHAGPGKGSLRFDAVLGASFVLFAAMQTLITGLVSVLTLVMVEGWNVSQAEAAAVVSWSRLAGLVGVVVAGTLGDRWRPAASVRGFFGLAAATTLAMAVLPYGPLFVAGVFVAAAAASGAAVLVSIVVAQAYPESLRARALSFSSGASGVLGLAVLPALFGAFVEQGWTGAPFLVTALTSLGGVVLVGYLGQRQEVAAPAPGAVAPRPENPG